MVPEKSLGTGIGKICYRKKVSEPVSENFGTVKSTGIGIVNIWYRKKVSVSVSLKIMGTVTLCSTPTGASNGPGGLAKDHTFSRFFFLRDASLLRVEDDLLIHWFVFADSKYITDTIIFCTQGL